MVNEDDKTKDGKKDESEKQSDSGTGDKNNKNTQKKLHDAEKKRRDQRWRQEARTSISIRNAFKGMPLFRRADTALRENIIKESNKEDTEANSSNENSGAKSNESDDDEVVDGTRLSARLSMEVEMARISIDGLQADIDDVDDVDDGYAPPILQQVSESSAGGNDSTNIDDRMVQRASPKKEGVGRFKNNTSKEQDREEVEEN